MSQFKLFTNAVALFFSAFLIGSGVYGIFNPVSMGRNFGIKTTNAGNAIFFPGLAARNLAAGLTLLVLSAEGQNRALGVLMTCWTLCGLADIKILLDNPPADSMWIHVLFTGLLAFSGMALLS